MVGGLGSSGANSHLVSPTRNREPSSRVGVALLGDVHVGVGFAVAAADTSVEAGGTLNFTFSVVQCVRTGIMWHGICSSDWC